jgi:putative ABC transport system permease protein
MQAKVIPIFNLAISFIPVLLVLLVTIKWKLDWRELAYATVRMLVQLIGIGYLLSYIFEQNSPWWTLLIVLFMLTVSSWISLYSIKKMRKGRLKDALLALLIGALPVLILVTGFVIPSESWYAPAFIIPLAGMIFANAMNTISLGAERFLREREQNELVVAKRVSLKAALIPQINSFMAVGLVSLPGMMTGQILSGVDPLIAVRYQIVVMTMVLGAGGLSAAFFLSRQK